jgi:farnesyl-diphosphate farnesyltransferase
MVNVIRDVASDLHNGRCYWPVEILAEQGLTVLELSAMFAQPPSQVAGRDRRALEAVTTTLIDMADELVAIARPYVDAIPKSELRLRLACTWPLLLADETLQALRSHKTPLGRRIKVSRTRVYELLLRSSASAAADLLRASFAA